MHYRARPSFTVEVKRNNKRVPLTITAADSSPSERHRLADQLLFGGAPPLPVLLRAPMMVGFRPGTPTPNHNDLLPRQSRSRPAQRLALHSG